VSRGTWVPSRAGAAVSPTGLSPSLAGHSRPFRYRAPYPLLKVPQPRSRFPDPGLGCSPFARRYLGNRGFFLFLEVLRCFSSLGSRRVTYGFSHGRVGITPPRFPHSGIPGSMPACGSPGLIAACHALHRFPAPRHPPFALSSLTTTLSKNISEKYRLWLLSRSPYSIVKDRRELPRATSVGIPDSLAPPGGDDRIRTGDPLLAKQVLSQLSYIPRTWWAFLGSNQGPRAYQARALAG
jgi:hypothetical protein